MIVQPDFVDHWKTRLLAEITGDKSAPLVLLRLWGYCQTSKRSYFPDMTPTQLASICHWGDRKPACHVALVKCKFVEKLSPAGFTVHQWNEYNAKLIANWENGKLGGRPSNEEIASKIRESGKPIGSIGITQPKPIEQTEMISKKEQSGTDKMGSGSPFKIQTTGWPSLKEVESYFREITPDKKDFAERMAKKWFDDSVKNGWRDEKGQPIRDWKRLSEIYYQKSCKYEFGASPDRNKGYNANPVTTVADIAAKIR